MTSESTPRQKRVIERGDLGVLDRGCFATGGVYLRVGAGVVMVSLEGGVLVL